MPNPWRGGPHRDGTFKIVGIVPGKRIDSVGIGGNQLEAATVATLTYETRLPRGATGTIAIPGPEFPGLEVLKTTHSVAFDPEFQILDVTGDYGAAEAVGARLESTPLESSSPAMRPNPPLAACYGRQLERLGLPETGHAPDENIGSSDITHVSHALPTIHPASPAAVVVAVSARAADASQ